MMYQEIKEHNFFITEEDRIFLIRFLNGLSNADITLKELNTLHDALVEKIESPFPNRKDSINIYYLDEKECD